MRAFEADERDFEWERHVPHYRVYWFQGPENAVTVIDLVDVDIGRALSTASEFSQGDSLLWALASVEVDAAGERGSVWLSGMDYNRTPETPREWERRREMQRRYLHARSTQGEAPLLPNGLRLIEMAALWSGGWPLWEVKEIRHQLTGADLGLTPALSEALHEWNTVWQEHDESGPIPDGWQDRGKELWPLLQAELEGIAEVSPSFVYSDNTAEF